MTYIASHGTSDDGLEAQLLLVLCQFKTVSNIQSKKFWGILNNHSSSFFDHVVTIKPSVECEHSHRQWLHLHDGEKAGETGFACSCCSCWHPRPSSLARYSTG